MASPLPFLSPTAYMSSTHPQNSIQSLSVGDVVSAGVRIYRSNLKPYLKLSLFAYLWIFVPVYGWAKYAEISARISRLAFGVLTNQPESLQEAERQTHPKLWNFFVAGLLMGLIFFGMYIGFIITIVIVAIIGFLSTRFFPSSMTTLVPLMILFGVLILLAFLVLSIRIFSRLFILEVPLAMENNLDGSSTMRRSWALTYGSVGRIQWIVVVAFLLTLLIQVPSQVLSAILPVGEEVGPAVSALSFLIVTVISLISGALMMPFWQVIKAVVYYDLRSRREGFGLTLQR